MKQIRHWLILCAYLAISTNIFSSNLNRITGQDGLSCLSVFCLHQDAFGYIWAGTYEGLNMLNGNKISVYRTGNNGYNQISGDLIEKIHETKSGVLWIHSNFGFDKLDTNTGKIEYHPEINGTYKSVTSKWGDVLAINTDELCLYYNKEKHKFIFTKLPGVNFSEVLSMSFDSRRNLIVVQKNVTRIFNLRYKGGQLNLLQKKIVFHSLSFAFAGADGYTMYFMDNDYNVYIAGNDYSYHKFVCHILPPEYMKGLVSAIIRDDDCLIVGFKKEGAMSINLKTKQQDVIAIPNGVYDVKRDVNQNILWIATDGGGIYKYVNDRFDIDYLNFYDSKFQITKQARALYKDHQGNFWIGTKGDGLYKFTKTNMKIFPVHYNSDNSELGHDMVFNIAPSKFRSIFWIGCEGDGISYYSFEDNKVHLVKDSNNPLLRCVHYVVESGINDIWAVSNWCGLFHLKLGGSNSKPTIIFSRQYLYDNRTPGRSQFFTIRKQDSSWIWLANRENGIYRLDLKTGILLHLMFTNNHQSAINDVHTLCVDIPGHVLVGTSAGLLDLKEIGKGVFVIKNISKKVGIGKLAIRSILKDSDSSFWATTAQGLLFVDLRTMYSAYYKGMGITEFCDGACYHDTLTGIRYFGGTDAVVTVKNNHAKTSLYHPPIMFRSINDGKREYSLSEFLKVDSCAVLGYDQTHFSIDFDAVDFADRDSYIFEYRLSNMSDKWHINNNGHSLALTGMPPGNYTLEMRYHFGSFVSPSYNLRIRITPPWYSSTLAKITYCLLCILTIIYVLRLYVLKQRRKREQIIIQMKQHRKEEIYESKLQFFTNLTHEFSMPLTLISGPCQRILKSPYADEHTKKYALLIRDNVNRLKELTQDILEFRKVDSEHRQLYVELVDIRSTLKDIAESFAILANRKKIVYDYKIEDIKQWPTDHSALVTIVTNLISNSIENTINGGKVSIKVENKEEKLFIRVENTGNENSVENLNRIFNKYHVIDMLESQSSKDKDTHNVLGMAICYGLVKIMGGTMNADIENSSRITVMNVIIPPLELSTNRKILSDRPYIGNSTTLSQQYDFNFEKNDLDPELQNILIIDANVEMRWFMNDFFSGQFNVADCTSTNEAYDKLKSQHIDLIITDLNTVPKNAVDFCKELKSDSALSHIPIIILSSLHDDYSRVLGIDAGDIYITKPFDEDNFRSIVTGLLHRSDVLMDYYSSSLSSFEVVEGRILHQEEKALLEQMISIININITNPQLSTSFVASQMGIGVRSLYRRLRHISKDTPTSVIRNARLERARQLLIHTSLTVEEVALKAGFANRSTFYNLFVIHYGSTPREYQENNKRKAKDILSSEAKIKSSNEQ